MHSFFHIHKPPEEFEFWQSWSQEFESAKRRRNSLTSVSSALQAEPKSPIFAGSGVVQLALPKNYFLKPGEPDQILFSHFEMDKN